MDRPVVEQINSGRGRSYKITFPDGKSHMLPSVTTILKLLDKGEGLKQWAINQSVDYIKTNLVNEGLSNNGKVDITSDEFFNIIESSKKASKNSSQSACDIGSKVHDYIEKYNGAGGDVFFDEQIKLEDQKVQNGFWAFKKWADDNKFKPIHSELDLYNVEIGYAGKTDCIGVLNGKLYLVDFKTSTGFYDDYPLQLSAYGVAYNNLYPDNKISGIGVLRLDKITGQPEWKDYSGSGSAYFKMFSSLCEVFKAKKQIEKENKTNGKY